MKEVNANQFRPMYAELNVNLDKLGCIMLDVDGSLITNELEENELFYTANKDRFWINGFVAGKTPHVTLLYGLLQSGNTTYRKYVDEVLRGWSIDEIEIDHIGFFESPYADEPYYCVVAHVKITDNLRSGHNRLQLLPHINTFPDYKAHITLAYVKKDEAIKDKTIAQYSTMLAGKKLKVTTLNYGK